MTIWTQLFIVYPSRVCFSYRASLEQNLLLSAATDLVCVCHLIREQLYCRYISESTRVVLRRWITRIPTDPSDFAHSTPRPKDPSRASCAEALSRSRAFAAAVWFSFCQVARVVGGPAGASPIAIIFRVCVCVCGQDIHINYSSHICERGANYNNEKLETRLTIVHNRKEKNKCSTQTNRSWLVYVRISEGRFFRNLFREWWYFFFGDSKPSHSNHWAVLSVSVICSWSRLREHRGSWTYQR